MISKFETSTLKLLRVPFSVFLMPVYLLALSQTSNISAVRALYSFFIIHLLVYPASNGYNSYVDSDEGPVGGLEAPPKPTKQLFYTTLVMDLLALTLSLILIGKLFTFCVLLYILASRAYSARQIRLKKYPVIGFLTVVFFQGGFTYFMSSLGITDAQFEFNFANVLILIACSLQIAGAYPLTQIYQHKDDLQDGVVTLSYRLGIRGTFIFTAILFGFCNLAYYFYFNTIHQSNHFFVLQVFFLPIVLYFLFWFLKTENNAAEANFKNTMRMNAIASTCMSACFILFYILNH